MIDFKTIKLSDIDNYKKYYDYSTALGCDTNLLNAYLWRNEYNIKFSIVNDTLIKAYFTDETNVWGYCMPTGKNVRFAIDEIFADAEERGQAPRLVMLTKGQRAVLESLYPARFSYSVSPENQDYIYSTKELIMLSGRKFHAKRNHITRFYKKYNDFSFKTIDSSNKDDAMLVAYEWTKENNLYSETNEELIAIHEALDNFETFKMSGAVLYVENKPIAMTLGSEISPRVFDVNFEKALREYDGAYAVINNEFAKTLTKYEYINREEDMGIEGLRKSKLSYNPVIILDRFNAELK